MALRNIDRTDRELLIACTRCADDRGVIHSSDVAEYLGINTKKNGRSPAGQVSARLSWMARPGYEMLIRLDPKTWGFKSNEAVWMVSDLGKEVMDGGNIPKAILDAIAKGSAGRRLKLMSELSRAGSSRGAELNILRRQWQHDWFKNR